jgi:RNA polymerase sigma-70 factor (ECF subfamily)
MQRDLVIRAQQGDHDAFSALASEAIGRLHTMARLILRDVERADDAVQDALLGAWLDIRGVRDPDRFEAWLTRLLLRACYRLAGRERRSRVIELHLRETDDPVVADGGAQLALRDQLERVFCRLPPEQRAVLVLHHYLGLSDGEAAEVLGIPVGTMKSRLSRATGALRAALEADERRLPLGRRSTT